MKKRKVANQSLLKYTDYRLKKMLGNGEIDKCPECKRYHEKNIKNAQFIYSLSLCDDCKATKELLENWLEQKNKEK